MFRWYVINTYSGHENKVKTNLEHRIQSMDMGDKIYQVLVPTEEEIEIKNGKLFINDQPVPVTVVGEADGRGEGTGRPYYRKPKLLEEQLGTVTHELQYLRDQSGYDFGPVLVPKESVFVMGDNRDNSQDSRVWGWVKYNKILGRALVIYWSWDGGDRWVRWERLGSLIK